MFHLENVLNVFRPGATNHVLSFSLVNFQSHSSCSSIQCYWSLLKRFRDSTNNIDINRIYRWYEYYEKKKRAVSEVYEELKERATVGLNIRVKKTKSTVQNRWTRRIIKILATKDHDIDIGRSFINLGTVIDNTTDETEEIKARILAANKAYSSLPTKCRSKQIHQNNDRTNAMYIWRENITKNLWPNTRYRMLAS